jgi:hypothetical protein
MVRASKRLKRTPIVPLLPFGDATYLVALSGWSVRPLGVPKSRDSLRRAIRPLDIPGRIG